MLKTLVKKQFFEVFKGYFYDAKKNRMRSKFAIAAWFVFFAIIMVGMLGGIFLALSATLCGPLVSKGLDWLYFLVMGGTAIVLGSFGSVYNSYVGLYLSKDNDLLLSMPIPIEYVIGSRLINVYLLGVMYILTVLVPCEIVYFITAGISVSGGICALLFFLCVSAIVMLISCGLGVVIAKISLRLKNKSFMTVFVTLAAVGAYFLFYFKAADFISELLLNSAVFAAAIKKYAYVLYIFGKIGEGDIPAAIVYTLVFAATCFALWRGMLGSFIGIATASGKTERVVYNEKKTEQKQKTVSQVLIWKEFLKFTSSSTYMINCGLGIILMPVAGILMLFKGKEFLPMLNEMFGVRAGTGTVMICAGILFMAAMIDTAMPSVSLEGKNLWILKSMPIKPQTILTSKALLQILLSVPPTLIMSICTGIVLDESLGCKLLVVIMPLVYVIFAAILETVFAVRMSILEWSNEAIPIKQSGAAFVTMISFWAIFIVFVALYLIVGYNIGIALYLLLWTIVFAVSAAVLFLWLRSKGAKIFTNLG